VLGRASGERCRSYGTGDPHDKDLHDLVGELSTRSEDFRRRWSAHDVRYHGAGVKHFHHQVVGNLDLAYESVDMISEPGLTLTIYAAEPASPTAQALGLLASWAATQPAKTPEQTTQPSSPLASAD
jgi:MmyB-like transcription regulator ligand binding domain